MYGMSPGRRPLGDEETWWWNEEVNDAIRARKEAKKKWDTPGTQEERYTAMGKHTRSQRKKCQ